MPWDPNQYQKFQSERAAPFEDLVSLGVFRPGLSIVDLGCGSGELTKRLASLSTGSQTVGVDSSKAMLERARVHEGAGLRFELGEIETWKPARPLDLVFSHAALHWVEDHPELFTRLAGFLGKGGQLLVQMPSNHDHVSHRIVRELAASSPWRERLSGFSRETTVLSIDAYAELLHGLGLERPTVFEKVYGHVLPDSKAVLEWLRGTLLVPYLDRLSPEDGQAFLLELGARLDRAITARPYYYAYRRTLIAARRG
jgi:trans-aconitate 2-methyltransferase